MLVGGHSFVMLLQAGDIAENCILLPCFAPLRVCVRKSRTLEERQWYIGAECAECHPNQVLKENQQENQRHLFGHEVSISAKISTALDGSCQTSHGNHYMRLL